MHHTAPSAHRLTTALRGLHPAQANRRPALFILEVAAALASVLALRDGISGSQQVLLETLFTFGLWATLLAVACGSAILRPDGSQATRTLRRSAPSGR